MQLNRARRHEDLRLHVASTRELDIPPSDTLLPPSDPVDLPSSREQTPDTNDWWDELALSDTDIGYHAYIATSPAVIHGPALDDDPQDYIYDNFSGMHAASRAQAASETDAIPPPIPSSDVGPILRSEGDYTMPPPEHSDAASDAGEFLRAADWWPWRNRKVSSVVQ